MSLEDNRKTIIQPSKQAEEAKSISDEIKKIEAVFII